MHLTRSTNLGLQIVLELTRQQTQKDGAERLTAASISEALEASPTHVAKLTSRLVDIGIITSSRGRTGGISIAPGGLNLRLGDLIRELEGDSDSVDRFIDRSICARISNGPCILTQSLIAAEEKFYTSLNELTVADVLPPSITPTPSMLNKPSQD